MDQEAQPSAARRRGRPPGTGRDDGNALAAVADILQAHPGMKPTTAMRRQAGGAATDSGLRRLQVKWKVEGSRLLAEAAGRAREKEKPREHDPTRSAAATAIAMSVHVASMACPKSASTVAGQHARLLESIRNPDWKRSATAEAIHTLWAVEHADPVHRMVRDYGREMARLGVDLTGSASATLSREMADLSRIAGVMPETSLVKELKAMVESTDHLIDPSGRRRRG